MTTYWAEYAWLGGDAVTAGVLIDEVGGLIADVRIGAPTA